MATWQAKLLSGPPMIAPARSFVYPQAVPGEEDALARGSVWVEIKPTSGGAFLAQCAIGFTGSSVANGIFTPPQEDTICIAAGGYVYLIDTLQPEKFTLIPLRPVVQVVETPGHLIFVGFQSLYIHNAQNNWETPRLSYEGLSQITVEDNLIKGLGWDLMADTEVPFEVNLTTQTTKGGAFRL